MLVEHGSAGRVVVRLKGGDPFVFGRGGEEAEALAEAGVRFEIVPGVTAGVAAPAYAGIPVTHRDEASAVAFVTAHEDPAKPESALDWAALAAFPGTLVFYMGVRALPVLAAALVEHGRASTEPAAVVERGTLPGQRTVTGPLEQIATLAQEAGVRAPAITVVGPVAALRDRLAWLERAPLFGRRVAVTRARAQASGLARRLEELGAEVVEAPAIRIEPRADGVQAAIDELGTGRCDVLCLTSPNGAELLMDGLDRQGLDARVLAGTRVAAIGPGTAAVLKDWGITADLVPERAIAESLAAELVAQGVADQRVLIPRAADARDVLPRELEQAGADVQVIPLYETVRERLDEQQLERLSASDYVTFTSSSTVRFLLEAIGGVEHFPERARVVSIGPVTSQTARDLGLEVHIEAERHDVAGLVDALLRDAAGGRAGSVGHDLAADLLPVRLRAARRVGGRLSWRDRAHRLRRDRDRHRARSAAHRRPACRIRAGERAAVPSPRDRAGGRRPGRRRQATRGRVAVPQRDRAGRPRQRPAVARGAGSRRSRLGGGRERNPVPPRSRLGHLSRPGRVRSGGGPPRARRCAGGCRQRDRSPRHSYVSRRRRPRWTGGRLRAEVRLVDRFGNVQLQARAQDMERAGLPLGACVNVAGRFEATRGSTFADVASGELVVYEDSSGWIAVAVNGGSAAAALAVEAGSPLTLSPCTR